MCHSLFFVSNRVFSRYEMILRGKIIYVIARLSHITRDWRWTKYPIPPNCYCVPAPDFVLGLFFYNNRHYRTVLLVHNNSITSWTASSVLPKYLTKTIFRLSLLTTTTMTTTMTTEEWQTRQSIIMSIITNFCWEKISPSAPCPNWIKYSVPSSRRRPIFMCSVQQAYITSLKTKQEWRACRIVLAIHPGWINH